MSDKPRIVVVGAGVSGLTTAIKLAQSGKYDVAVIAKHMPGDYDASYASPWAGAEYLPESRAGSPDERIHRDTWHGLEHLARNVPEAGIHFQKERRYFNYPKDGDETISLDGWIAEVLTPGGPWWKDILPSYRRMKSEDAAPFDAGIEYTSVCINVAIYLPWLAMQLLKLKVSLHRATLNHIAEARDAHPSGKPANVIVNCTGLGSFDLPGVEDKTMFPARGQITLVRNEPNVMVSISGGDWPKNERCYLMQRAAGGGTVLGGCFQAGDWNGQVDHEMAKRIMERTVNWCPELTDEKSLPKGSKIRPGRGVESLDVVRHGVGLRPCRKDGVRIEAENLENGVVVVHNYGHGGEGYERSWGSASKVVQLVQGVLP